MLCMTTDVGLSSPSNGDEKSMQIWNESLKVTCIDETKFLFMHSVLEMMLAFR